MNVMTVRKACGCLIDGGCLLFDDRHIPALWVKLPIFNPFFDPIQAWTNQPND